MAVYPLGLLKFAKMAAGLAAIQTALCGVLVLIRQTVIWFSTGEWGPYRISSLIRDLSADTRGFVMAGSELNGAAEGGSAPWTDVLQTPTSIALLFAFLFFLQLFGWISMLEADHVRHR
jgi:hypothetical protein